MNFKFINEEGKEVKIRDLGSFTELVKNGQIKDDTLLYSEQDSKWKKASEFKEFQAVLSNLEKSNNESTSALPALEANTRDRRKKLILVSVLLILTAIILLSVASAKYYTNAIEGIVYEFAYLLGYTLLLFLIIIPSYLIWRFFLNKMKGGFILSFSLLFLIISGYQSVKMLKEISQAKIAVKDINTTIKDFLVGKEINQKNDTSQSHVGPASLSAWLSNYLSAIQQYQAELTKAIKNEQIENILLTSTLSDPNKITEAKQKLKKFRQLIDNHEKWSVKKLEEAAAGINSLDLENEYKKEVIAAIYEGKKLLEQFLKEYLAVERSLIAEMNNLLDFLNMQYGKYRFESDQIFFATEKDATQYNSYIQKINHIALEEALLLNKWQDTIKPQQFEKLLQ